MNNQVLKLFSDIVSIQSVSADSKRHKEILEAADFIKKELLRLGCHVNLYQKENCPPLIIARKTVSSGVKTIGVYAHYDVQPEDPVDQWKTAPFKLTINNGKILGRGTADDKGHLIQTIAAFGNLIDKNKLTNNLIFIFEGEEEVGSGNFEELIKKDPLLKEIDVFYVMDFGMETSDQPEIFFGLRGLIAFELELITGKKDLHSGVYGNRVYNPINVLTGLLSKIKDQETGKILIPGFYNSLRKPTKKEWENLLKKKQVDKELKKEAEVFTTFTVDKKYPWLSTKIYPSFDLNGIIGGYVGEGVKTIIPASARAKFSFRLIENQTPDNVEKLVNDFVKKNIPGGVRFSLKTLGKLEPFYTNIDNRYVEITDKIFKDIFGRESLFTRSGGSIGAAATLSYMFKKPLILTGFTLADCNIHSPNENFDEGMFWKGIVAMERIFAQ
ncbi:M20/M25/M40 family metallo-hydrolase [Candidatus Roizmanbacteria bacterium]|nr:M20/M25/M40 family metallo-hydrolase [Candidatus Roizmanbacteria bacterium]